MSGTAVVPAWVVSPPGQVRDAHCIAHALAAVQPDSPTGRYLSGVAASVDWVTGGGPAPASGRYAPATVAEARAETLEAAEDANYDEYARGVAMTLAWLLGAGRVPLEVPQRGPNGAPLTAAELYAERTARRHFLPPEDRRALRGEAERDAARYRDLARLAADAVAV